YPRCRLAFETREAARTECEKCRRAGGEEPRGKSTKKRHVTDEQNICGPAIDDVDPGLDWIVGIQPRHRFDGDTRAEPCRGYLGGLLRPQFATLADALHPHAGARDELGQTVDVAATLFRQRPLWIHRFGECVAMLK